MRKKLIIAVDGPAGAGKSDVGSFVARELGYWFVNTGEMYRALTWKALQRGISPEDERALIRLAKELKWEFKPVDGALRTYLNGRPVGQAIRAEKVGRCSSQVASVAGVRKVLRNLQRRLGRSGGVVMEGRDITTDVFPNADFKFYLDASLKERALRRYRQLRARGKRVDLEHIKQWILKRDFQDSRRKVNPLRKAEDAVVVDTTRMTLRQVARYLLRHILSAQRMNRCRPKNVR